MKKESGPKHLRTLFERYKKNLQAPQQTVVTTTQAVIEDLLELKIPTRYITYTPQTRVLTITHGMYKSEILPHKQLILDHIKGRIGDRSAPTTIL